MLKLLPILLLIVKTQQILAYHVNDDHQQYRHLATCPSGSVMDSTGKFCCPSTCGTCGGYGCDTRPGGATNCCTSKISNSCDSSSAPCIASTSNGGQCPSGGILDSTGKICCLASCGSCGGSGCDKRIGGVNGCCTSKITTSCASGILPCIISDGTSSDCPTGSILDSGKEFCCPASCGSCGGSGCNTRPGGYLNCCTSQISTSCDGSTLPCVISTKNDSSNCPSKGIFDSNGEFCCPVSCGSCGGSGCDTRPGGASFCCTSRITASCSGNTLPCKWTSDEKTTEPTSDSSVCPNNGILDASGKFCCDSYCESCMETTCIDDYSSSKECCLDNDMISCTSGDLPCVLYGDADFSVCSNGLISDDNEGYCELFACCSASCDECVVAYDCSSSPECCATTNTNNLISTDVDVSCRVKEPPCIIPPVDDPCTPNPCKNGARCGIQWNSFEGHCILQPVCECSEVGNDSGQFCEIPCSEGETPCGLQVNGYISTEINIPNNICCSVDEECMHIEGKYGYFMGCYPKVRPENCDPNPCLNGGGCDLVNYYDFNQEYPWVFMCNCPVGFEGSFCEIEL